MKVKKSFSILLSLMLLATMLCPGSVLAEDKGTLLIQIINIPATEGYVMVAVYDSEKAYSADGEAAATARINVSAPQVEAVFPDLANGWYGVAVYHDRNANGKLDSGVFGIPKEAYGHSNNVRGTFGPPAFDKIKFELNKTENRITINLK